MAYAITHSPTQLLELSCAVDGDNIAQLTAIIDYFLLT